MDLQSPDAKMSTTSGTEGRAGLYRRRARGDRQEKIKRAQTPTPGSDVVRGPDKAGITNLIDIYSVALDVPPEQVEREFEGQGYGAFKQSVEEAVAELLVPVRERYAELRADEDTLKRTLASGRGAGERDRRSDHGGGAFRDGTRRKAVVREAVGSAWRRSDAGPVRQSLSSCL